MALAKVKRQRTAIDTIEYKSDQEKKVESKEKAESAAQSNSENEEDELTSNGRDEEDDGEEGEEGNAGWADSIAKVLSSTKPKTKKTVVLSRAKKLQSGKESAKKEKPTYDFEVEGEIKDEKKPDLENLKENAKQRKNLHLDLRVRPTWKDLERERILRKIATKGVVQLFNAVRMQQKDLEQKLEEAGPLESRKDSVLNNINKKKFLDVLMSGSRAKSDNVDNSVKIEKKEEQSSDDDDDEGEGEDDVTGRKRKSKWDVLRPDFMTSKKIKHWDENDDDSDVDQNHSNPDSEDDNEE